MTPRLSRREHEIADLIGAGFSYPAIAAKLGIEPETVRSHVNRIAGRLPDDGCTAYRRVMKWKLASAAKSA